MNAREKETVSRMIRLYCRSQHGQQETLCSGCMQLEVYAYERLERCRFGEKKPICQKCPVHCYRPELRRKIQEVMRFAGPRMLWHHPADALWHVWKITCSKFSR